MTDIFGSRGALWLDEQASEHSKAPTTQASATTTVSKPVRATTVTLLKGSDVVMRPIPWLWEGYLAGGKMTILAGSPGTGKTTAALALAATVTAGGLWPDGTKSEQGNIAVWSAEDDIADTLAPRLALAGADMTRVLFVSGTQTLDKDGTFDPSRHMDALGQALEEAGGCRLLIVDPVVSAVAGDSHKNAEVRRGLQPLVDLASATGAAIIGITHLSKATEGRGPIDRISGSLAFGALARSVLMTAAGKDGDGTVTRLLLRAKSNLSAVGGGFEYDIEQGEVEGASGVFASRVQWGEWVEGDARELLAEAEDSANGNDDDGPAETKDWLVGYLRDKGGYAARKEILAAARSAGFSERTVQRARKRAGITHSVQGFGAGKQSTWSLPEAAISANRAIHAISPESQNNGADGTDGTDDRCIRSSKAPRSLRRDHLRDDVSGTRPLGANSSAAERPPAPQGSALRDEVLGEHFRCQK